jgi:phage tail protein X
MVRGVFTAGLLFSLFGAILLGESTRAAGPAACASEKSCESENEIVVYECLERRMDRLTPACKKAVLSANPGLRQEPDLRSGCSRDIPKVCPGVQGLALSSCLEDRYRQISRKCFDTISRLNSAFRPRADRARRRRAEVEFISDLAHAAVEHVEYQEYVETVKVVSSAERRTARERECRQRLSSELKDPSHPIYEALCPRYALIPVPAPDQSRCLEDLQAEVRSSLKTLESDKISNETMAWEVCQRPLEDAQRLACARKKLHEGDELPLAWNSCHAAVVRCQEDFFGGKNPGSKTERELVIQLCRFNHETYRTTQELMDSEAPRLMREYRQTRNGKDIAEQLSLVAADHVVTVAKGLKKMACMKDLRKSRPALFKASNLKTMDSLCARSDEYRACFLPKFFALPKRVWELSDPLESEEALSAHWTCLVRTVLSDSDRDAALGEEQTPCP